MKKYTNEVIIILALILLFSLSACSSSGNTSTPVATPTATPTEAAEVTATEAAINTTPIYVAGTYSATAQGMGIVSVEITVDEHSITAISIDVSNETPAVGGAQGDTLSSQIMETQSADIDGVSGATVTSDAVKTAAMDCLAQAAN